MNLTCLTSFLQLHTTVIRDGAVEGLCSYARTGAGLQGLSRHRLLTGEGMYIHGYERNGFNPAYAETYHKRTISSPLGMFEVNSIWKFL